MTNRSAKVFRLFILLLLGMLGSGCAPTVGHYFAEVVPILDKGQSVAVTRFFDEHTGNITALGESWRDQVEIVLKERGLDIKARKDLGMIVDEMVTFGRWADGQTGYEESGADFVVGGSYAVLDDGSVPTARLTIKAFHVADGSLAMARSGEVVLPSDWKLLAAETMGNAYHHQLDQMESKTDVQGLSVQAELDRENACYPSGAPARITVHTEPDNYIYILHLLADHKVDLVYPNEHLPDQPHPTGHLEFPPQGLQHLVPFTVHPVDERRTCEQGIKVVASRTPIDLSYLASDGIRPHKTASHAQLKSIAASVREQPEWEETSLDYWVGPDCDH